MEKYKDYDGWAVKELRRKPFFYTIDFAETRMGVIKKFEKIAISSGLQQGNIFIVQARNRNANSGSTAETGFCC